MDMHDGKAPFVFRIVAWGNYAPEKKCFAIYRMVTKHISRFLFM